MKKFCASGLSSTHLEGFKGSAWAMLSDGARWLSSPALVSLFGRWWFLPWYTNLIYHHDGRQRPQIPSRIARSIAENRPTIYRYNAKHTHGDASVSPPAHAALMATHDDEMLPT